MPEETIIRQRMPHIPGLDTAVTPLLGLGLGLTGLALRLRPHLAPFPLALTALATIFYRDPKRITPSEPETVFAVSDGTVITIDEIYEHRFLHTDSIRIATALSPLDVPVNRSPVTGVVRYVEYIHGEYLPVTNSAAAERNSRVYIGIQTNWGPVLVAQIASPIARRIVCRVQVDDDVAVGQRIGTIRFGARTDLIVQRDTIETLAHVGQHLTAGLSRAARIIPLS